MSKEQQPDMSLWVYTSTGELPSTRKVEIRHQILNNTIWLRESRDTVLQMVTVKEPAPSIWPEQHRLSVVMIGLGQQRKRDFHVIQFAGDWERDLMDAARPMLGLAGRVLTASRWNSEPVVLAGRWVNTRAPQWPGMPLWPSVDIKAKTVNVWQEIRDQQIGPQVDRTGDISEKDASRLWADPAQREGVWRHNFLDVIETSMKIFQIEEI